ncbi:MAG TPA: hypothetical protein VN628_19140, partial [Vicinamibacterales bacterium]|nr:hypothetical protein [Vicinamibacterales bacterium]
VFSVRLERVRYTPPTTTPDRQYLDGIPLAAGVDASWYEQNPPEIPRIRMSPDDEARFNANNQNPYFAFRIWNSAFVRMRACESPDHGHSAFGDQNAFLVFDSPEDQPYPSYRHMPHVSPPGWFVVNSFGWRGPDLTVARPPATIRIAFVGSSTTIDPYYQPFSHIELVGLWLNEWASARKLPYRFEVINAARTGIDSWSIREVVRQEVLSVDPDLIVYYEGANDFAPGKAMRLPEALPLAPKATFSSRGKAEEFSAIAVRVYDLGLKLRGIGGYEPRKPNYPFKWIDGISESSPDISKPRLPMDQQVIVDNLKLIQAAAAANGTDLGIASFVWMVYPGMRLDLSKHLVLFRYLNETYFPATYAHMRRMADFQNRVFRAFVNAYGLTYLPMDETYPRDPDLFGDAIHMTERGQRLQAWIYLQELIPIIQARIDAHRWPKAPAATPVSAAWATTPPHTVSLAQVIESCPTHQ